MVGLGEGISQFNFEDTPPVGGSGIASNQILRDLIAFSDLLA